MATPSGTETPAPSATSLPGLLATPSGTATGAAGAARGAAAEQGDIVIGLVQSVDTSSGAIRIDGEQGPVTLATSASTQMLGANGDTVGLPGFQAGALVRADGQTDAVGNFIASRVQVINRSDLLTVLGQVTGKSADGRVVNINSLPGGFSRLYLTRDATVTLPDGRNYSAAELVPGMNVEAIGIRGTPGTLITYHVSVLQR